MNKIDEINDDIQGAVDEIEYWKKKLIALRQQKANITCPFKIGDVVSSKYSNNQWVIIEIKGAKYASDNYRLIARNLKKDGSEGKIEREISWMEPEKTDE